MNRALIEAATNTNAVDYVRATAQLRGLARRSSRSGTTTTCVLTPTLAQPPPEIGAVIVETRGSRSASPGRFTAFTQIANMTGLPAVSLPLLLERRRPADRLQLIGRPAGRGDAVPRLRAARAGPAVARPPPARSLDGVLRHAAFEQHRPQRLDAEHPHRLARLRVAEPRWGTRTTFSRLEQAGVDLRLVLEDVERRAGEPSRRAARSTSASSSTIGPRLVFTSTAVGFIRASATASIRCRDSSVNGRCSETTSAVGEQVVERQPTAAARSTRRPCRGRERAARPPADPAMADEPEREPVEAAAEHQVRRPDPAPRRAGSGGLPRSPAGGARG